MANVNTLPSVSSLSNMGILNNEVLASYDNYNYGDDGQNYVLMGKIYSQDFHYWGR